MERSDLRERFDIDKDNFSDSIANQNYIHWLENQILERAQDTGVGYSNLPEGKTLIRIYKYRDIYKGWGDAGTIGYIVLDEDLIDKKEEERMPEAGGTFISESLSEEGKNVIRSTFEELPNSYPTWGWERSDFDTFRSEREEHQEMLNRLKIQHG